MKLADYQAAVLGLAFADEPPSVLPGSFTLYREMMRDRLFAMAEVAYARSWAAHAEACERSFARFLATEPPTSPHLRHVIGAFGAFAASDSALLASLPAHAADLLRFEACVWNVASAPRDPAALTGLRELDFEGALALEPTLTSLRLTHGVESPATERAAESALLLVYRRASDDATVHWYRASSPFAALLALVSEGPAALGTLVRRVLAPDGEDIDPEALSDLVADLTLALERGVVLGVRAISA